MLNEDFDKENKEIAYFVDYSLKKEFFNKDYTSTPVWKNMSIQWLQLTESENLLIRQKEALIAGFKTVIAFPVLLDEDPISILYIFFNRKVLENKDTENLLNICAKQLSNQCKQASYEQLYFDFLKKSTDLLCITNLNGKIITFSKSYKEFVGIEGKALLYKNFTDLVPGNNMVIDHQFIDYYSGNPKETFDIEYPGNMETRTITWNATVVKEAYKIIFSGKDITQKIQVSNRLKENNLLLEQAYNDVSTILNNTKEIIYKLDLSGTIIEVSASIYSSLGYQQNDIIGKSFLFFTHVDEVEAIYEIVITNLENHNIVKHLKHRIKAKDGSWKWLSTSGQTIFNSNGDALYIMCISKDISESYMLEKNSEEIKEKYENYFKSNPLPVIICDLEENHILESNEAACKLYGYTSEEFKSLKPNAIKIEELPDNYFPHYTINEKKFEFKIEKNQKHIKKNEAVFYAKIFSSQILIDNKLCLICTIIDISNEINQAASIKFDFTFADYFLENTKDSYYCFTTKNPIPIHINFDFLQKRIAETFYLYAANDVFVKRYGFDSFEKMKGLSMKEISNVQQLDYKTLLQELIRNNFLLKDSKVKTTNAAGENNYFVANIKGIIEDGKLVSIIGSSRNITDKTNAENALKTSLQTFESITENTAESISRYEVKPPFIVTKNKKQIKKAMKENTFLVESNNIISKRLGIEKKEALYGFSLEKILTLHKIDIDVVLDAFVENNFSLTDFETKFIDGTGNLHYISMTVKSNIENGKINGLWTSTKNITTEKIGINRTAYLADIIDHVKDAIYSVDKDFQILTWNKGAENIFGLRKEMVIGKKIIDILTYNYHEIDRKEVLAIIGEKGTWMGEVKFVHPLNKEWITLLSTISKSTQLESNTDGFIITSKNISEIKLAEAKLAETESRFKKIANFAPVMIWQTGKSGEKYFYNEKIAAFTGLSINQLLTTPWPDLILPVDNKVITPYINNQIQNQKPFTIEYRLLHHSGQYKWILDKATPRFLADGSFDGYIGVCVDIHETKKSFEIIKESEERFKNMADQAPVMIWLTDENDHTTYYNEGWLRFTGKKLAEELSTPWELKIYEPDREKAQQTYQTAFLNKAPFLMEYRLISKNNEFKWILDRGNPRFLKNGDFAGYIGVCIDIHYLKKIEFDLKNANERYEIINEASNEALFESDLKRGITYWGAGFKKFFGYDNLEVDSEKWLGLVHKEDRAKVKKAFIDYDVEQLQKNNIINCTYRFLKADNNYCYVQDIAYILFDENGIPEKLFGSKKDISQQKELEEKVLQNEIDKQVAINKAMIEGQEKEKLELSQELHDNINQLISSAKLYMEVAKRSSTNNEMINKSIDTLGQAVLEMRRLSKSLNPTTINKLDIVDAIEQLVNDVEDTGKLVIVFDHSNYNYNISLPQLNLYLYRIVQEQINNILKYAKTEIANIYLENTEQYLFLRISDEGVGFDKNIKSKGIGLHNIINRVQLFKGKIDIITAPNQGCIVEINIPLDVEYF